jgi:hypothetical protein
MGHLPVLKPREIVALLVKRWDLANFGSGVRTNRFATLMVDAQQCRFMQAMIYHRFYFGKLQKILG